MEFFAAAPKPNQHPIHMSVPLTRLSYTTPHCFVALLLRLKPMPIALGILHSMLGCREMNVFGKLGLPPPYVLQWRSIMEALNGRVVKP